MEESLQETIEGDGAHEDSTQSMDVDAKQMQQNLIQHVTTERNSINND